VRDCNVPDPNEPDPGTCYHYNPDACGYVLNDPDWTEWSWVTEPTMDATLAENVPEDLDLWARDEGTHIDAAITVTKSEGERYRYDRNGCVPEEYETVMPDHDAGWKVENISADPSIGEGESMASTVFGSGPGLILFGVTAYVASPSWELIKVVAANRPVVKIVTRTIYSSALPSSRTVIGVAEIVECTVEPTPTGTVSWSCDEPGAVAPETGVSTILTAVDAALASGYPMKVTATLENDGARDTTLTIIPPYKIYEFDEWNHEETSVEKPIKIEVRAKTYLGPDSVNFSLIEQREGLGNAEAWGYFWYLNNEPHFHGQPVLGLTVVPGKGTLLSIPDRIGIKTEHGAPDYYDGGVNWPIDLEYRKAGGGPWHLMPQGVTAVFTISVDWEAAPPITTLRVQKSLVDREIHHQ
jgi:hypothetical protein